MRQSWILVKTTILSMITHYNHNILIGIDDIDALVWQGNLFFPPFSLESKFANLMRRTWILVIISISFIIVHHKHVLLIGIHDNNVLVWQEKLFFPPFCLESVFIHQMVQTWIAGTTSVLFMIRHHKHILLIGMHDINALV